MKHLLLVISLLAIIQALHFQKVLIGHVKAPLHSIVLDNYLVVAGDNCIYAYDLEGNAYWNECLDSPVTDLDLYGNRVAIATINGTVYLRSDGELRKVIEGREFSYSVKLLRDSLIACNTTCALVDLRGNLIWKREIGVVTDLEVKGDYVYVAHGKAKGIGGTPGFSVLSLRDGKVLFQKIEWREGESVYKESVSSVDVCSDKLVLGGLIFVYLFNISNPLEPKLLWRKDFEGLLVASSVRFSPNCSSIAVASYYGRKVYFLDLGGNVIGELSFGDKVTDLDWKRYLAVGLENGTFYLFGNLSAPKAFTVTETVTKELVRTATETVTTHLYTTVLLTSTKTVTFTSTETVTVKEDLNKFLITVAAIVVAVSAVNGLLLFKFVIRRH
ncbi:hypothetical protein EYM_02130 [Ignicoccus islandicus DSM 13165]|uniref:Uncharacterized protein n=1 Tax=Ignicoccus islandicus DSM 13165 TaxID=940295 RepID=A0A0U2WMV7_9CREN|nr:hypothetical protein [Ignicoccus islandicus]ALU12289.1 hypothetical protein EYM_02130 [Ignicoccus islandicus DSM 13165]